MTSYGDDNDNINEGFNESNIFNHDEDLDRLDMDDDAKESLSFATQYVGYRTTPKENRNSDYIELIALSDGLPIKVDFEFQVFFLLELPSHYSEEKLPSIKADIIRQTGDDGIRIAGFEYLEKIPARPFTFNRKKKLIKLIFNKKCDHNDVFAALSSLGDKIEFEGQEYDLIMYEDSIKPVERFCQLHLNSSGWMRCRKWIDLPCDGKSIYNIDNIDSDAALNDLTIPKCQYTKHIKTRLKYIELEKDEEISNSCPDHKVMVLDIETSSLDYAAPDAEIYQISAICYDYKTNTIKCFLFTWNYHIARDLEESRTTAQQIRAAKKYSGNDLIKLKLKEKYQDVSIEGVKVVNCANKKQMLSDFLNFYLKFNPDAVSYHNGWGFDSNFIISEAEKCGLKGFSLLGRTGMKNGLMKRVINSKDVQYREYPGRLQVDTMFFLQNFDEQQPSYSLDHCSKAYLKPICRPAKSDVKQDSKQDVEISKPVTQDGLSGALLRNFPTLDEVLTNTKGDVEGEEITGHFRSESYDKRYKLGLYCVKDSILTLRLYVERLMYLKTWKMGIAFRAPLQLILTSGKQEQVMPNILKYINDAGFFFNVYHNTSKDPYAHLWNHQKYPGGLVVDPLMDRYETPVIVFDFASMYPSNMMEYNICLQTILPTNCMKPEDWGELKNFKHTIKNIETEAGVEEIILIQQEGVGFAFEIQKMMVKWRKDAKAKMKNAKTDQLRAIFDCEQLAFKVYMNGMYGLFAPRERGKFSFLLVAATITQYGRELARQAGNFLINHPLIVHRKPKEVYGDTDSKMITFEFPEELKTEEEIMLYAFKVGKVLEADVNKMFNSEYVKMELEKIFYPFILWNKKKYYVGRKWMGLNKEGKLLPPNPKPTIVGIEGKKRDRCEDLRMLQFRLIGKMVKPGCRAEDIEQELVISLRRLAEGKVPIEHLVIVKGLSKDVSGYNTLIPHVQVAKKNKAAGLENFKKGCRISFIVYTSAKKYAKHGKGIKISDWCEDIKTAIAKKLKPDVKFYVDVHYKKALEKLVTPFGFDFEKIYSKFGQMAYRTANIGQNTLTQMWKNATENKELKQVNNDKVDNHDEVKAEVIEEKKFIVTSATLKKTTAKDSGPKQLKLCFGGGVKRQLCSPEEEEHLLKKRRTKITKN